jgi:hypothetical protein
MKKQIAIIALAAISMMTVSCQKEEIDSQLNVKNTANREEVNHLPYLMENPELLALVENSDEMNYILSQGASLEKAVVLQYEDPLKKCIIFPNEDNKSEYSGYTISLYDGKILKANNVTITGSEQYFQKVGERNMYTESGVPFTGTVTIRDLNGNEILVSDVDCSNKFPQWTPHGGYPSWADCVVAAAGTAWGVVFFVVAPYATLTGVAIGCL